MHNTLPTPNPSFKKDIYIFLHINCLVVINNVLICNTLTISLYAGAIYTYDKYTPLVT